MYLASNIVKTIAEKRILNDVNLQVGPGEILVILGPNGAGKSTLLKILALLQKPTEGKLILNGINAKKHPHKVKHYLGVVAHKTFLYENLTVYENLEFYGKIYGVTELKKKIHELTTRVGLELSLHEPVFTLSRGMQQKLAIARALIHNPSFLLLDEPQTGLDSDGLKVLYSLLGELKSQGTGIVVVTHLFDEMFELSDKLLVLNKGKPCFYGDIGLNSIQAKEHYNSLLIGGTA